MSPLFRADFLEKLLGDRDGVCGMRGVYSRK